MHEETDAAPKPIEPPNASGLDYLRFVIELVAWMAGGVAIALVFHRTWLNHPGESADIQTAQLWLDVGFGAALGVFHRLYRLSRGS